MEILEKTSLNFLPLWSFLNEDINLYFKTKKYSRIQYETFVKFEIFFLPSLVSNTKENLNSSICSFFMQLMNVATATRDGV